jgi:plasmid stabilization system protein ParE
MAKKIVIWSPAGRAEVRAIDRESAWQILQSLIAIWRPARATSSSSSRRVPSRLRAGDYRVLFRRINEQTIEVLRVRHRSEAYR